MVANQTQETGDKSVVVVGAGGAIGSHLTAHLGRTPQISRLTLIDKDVYEPGNIQTQEQLVEQRIVASGTPAKARFPSAFIVSESDRPPMGSVARSIPSSPINLISPNRPVSCAM